MSTKTEFRTASAYKDYIRALLNRHIGEQLDPGSEDGAQLYECLSRHPHWTEKGGEKATAFSIRRDFRTGGPRVFLLFEDRAAEDISWLKACAETYRRKPRDPEAAHRATVSDAARAAIHYQIERFKEAKRKTWGGWESELSGERISDPRLAHVDHDPVSFKTLLEGFVDEYLFGYWDVIATHSAPSGGYRFAVAETEEAWQKFHAERAVLRVITARENLTKPRS